MPASPKRTKKKRTLIGYIRVSSMQQDLNGISLGEQAASLRWYAKEGGYNLPSIHEDNVSAFTTRTSKARLGLGEAIAEALQWDGYLLVPSVSRLSRNPEVLKELDVPGLKVISIAEGGLLSKASLRSLIRRADSEINVMRTRTMAGRDAARKQGQVFGNRTNLPDAQRKGAISNVCRADKKVEALADFLQANSDALKMKMPSLVETLNRSGSLNLVSDRLNVLEPWTAGSLRRPLEKAKKLLMLRNEEDLEPIDFDDVFSEGQGKDAEAGVDPFYADDPLFGAFGTMSEDNSRVPVAVRSSKAGDQEKTLP